MTEIPQSRETFDQAFFTRAQLFATDVLSQIPELESVAVIPAWSIVQDRLPFGLLRGRNEQLGMAEMMRLLSQIQGTYEFLVTGLRQQLQQFDAIAAELAKRIEAQQSALEAVERQLTEARLAAPGDPEHDGPTE